MILKEIVYKTSSQSRFVFKKRQQLLKRTNKNKKERRVFLRYIKSWSGSSVILRHNLCVPSEKVWRGKKQPEKKRHFLRSKIGTFRFGQVNNLKSIVKNAF